MRGFRFLRWSLPGGNAAVQRGNFWVVRRRGDVRADLHSALEGGFLVGEDDEPFVFGGGGGGGGHFSGGGESWAWEGNGEVEKGTE